MVEEIVLNAGTKHLPSVVADIKHLGGSPVEEGKIALQLVGDIGLAPCWQTDHGNYKLVALGSMLSQSQTTACNKSSRKHISISGRKNFLRLRVLR